MNSSMRLLRTDELVSLSDDEWLATNGGAMGPSATEGDAYLAAQVAEAAALEALLKKKGITFKIPAPPSPLM